MRNSTFIRRIASLAVCALTLAALGSAKNPVTRPFTIRGNATLVLNLADGTWDLQDWGEATHGGRFVNYGSGTAYGAVGSGTATDVNGDQLFWVMPGSSWQVEWPGINNSGRFQNATGGFNVVSQSPSVTTPGPDPGTVTITYTYVGVGTITY